jgi:hypothetical protein
VPKAKKALSEEQKQVLRDRMAAARAKKAAMKAAETTTEEPSTRVEASPEPAAVQETIQNSNESTEAILARALEAIETLAKLQAQGVNTQTGPSMNNGRVVGTVTKYSINPDDYPSPVERIKAEARLAPFAFPLNYDLAYEVGTTSYQSKDGINFIEPKFKLELQRIVRDELTGEPTGRRLVLCRLAMHEDPQSALTVARDNGIDTDGMDELALLNEMRYIQMRDWVFESFFLPISTNRSAQNEMVVDGKIVEFFEVNDQSAKKLPFDNLSRFRG